MREKVVPSAELLGEPLAAEVAAEGLLLLLTLDGDGDGGGADGCGSVAVAAVG